METVKNTPEIRACHCYTLKSRGQSTIAMLYRHRLRRTKVSMHRQERRASVFMRLRGTRHRTAICTDWRTGHLLAANCHAYLIG